jgi:hypothetical protein
MMCAWVLIKESPKCSRAYVPVMEGAVCTAVAAPNGAQAKGLARLRRARWKHGLYSAEVRAAQKLVRDLLRQSRELLDRMEGA